MQLCLYHAITNNVKLAIFSFGEAELASLARTGLKGRATTSDQLHASSLSLFPAV